MLMMRVTKSKQLEKKDKVWSCHEAHPRVASQTPALLKKLKGMLTESILERHGSLSQVIDVSTSVPCSIEFQKLVSAGTPCRGETTE